MKLAVKSQLVPIGTPLKMTYRWTIEVRDTYLTGTIAL
jgi:hypothetical protein